MDGFDDVAALVDGERERLFPVNILFRSRGGHVHERVPVVGGGVDDDMNIFSFHHLAEIIINCRCRMTFDGESRGSLGGMSVVDVANRQDVTVTTGVGRIAFPHATATHEGDARAVVRGRGFDRLGRRQLLAFDKPKRQTGRGGEQAAALQESTPRDIEGMGRAWRRRRAAIFLIFHGRWGVR